ncbi:MAG: laminarinase, partial [Oscillospiraceae bacterium]|nr:laminarinase [Oscillospiraceae bacterium]
MNKKRILAFALCSALMTGLVSGCGSTDEAKDQQGSESNGTSQNSAAESTEIPEIEGYSLLWNDEFNGDKLDTTCWQYDPHEPGWTNSELQEYTTSEENG